MITFEVLRDVKFFLLFISMKKILLLSDTHSYIDDQILKFVKQADEVWHAGDIGNLEVTDTIKKIKPLRAVFGNIDDTEARSEFPLDTKFEITQKSCERTAAPSRERGGDGTHGGVCKRRGSSSVRCL